MVEQIMSFLAPILTLVVGWFLARRKNRAEAKNVEADAKANELENVETAIAIWRKVAEDLQEELKSRQISFDEKLDAISKQNDNLLKKLEVLDKEYNSLRKSYDGLKRQLAKG